MLNMPKVERSPEHLRVGNNGALYFLEVKECFSRETIYSHIYHINDYRQMVADINAYIAGDDPRGWEGNEAKPETMTLNEVIFLFRENYGRFVNSSNPVDESEYLMLMGRLKFGPIKPTKLSHKTP